MNYEQLQQLGWKRFFDAQLTPSERDTCQLVRVSAHHRGQLLVRGEADEFAIPLALAQAAPDPAVGDWLVVDPDTHRVIRALQRTSLMSRVAAGLKVRTQHIAANIDTIFIVMSCNEDFNLSRTERYLALVLQSGATPVVVLTKSDLVEDRWSLIREVEQLHGGLVVEAMDARDPDQARQLTDWCGPGQTVALVGSSGVGKSTIANSLGTQTQEVGEIRTTDGKGRHTTTWRSLHLLDCGGVLIDNPGMRELKLPGCDEGVAEVFVDVLEISRRCRFHDCRHQGDAGCAFPAAIAAGEIDERRFQSFVKLDAEQQHYDRTLQERRQRDRQFGRMYKATIADKDRRRRE